MRTCDDGFCRLIVCLACHLDVQFLGNSLFELDVYAFFLYVFLRFFQRLWREILDYFQLIFTLSYNAAQGNGDG